MKENYHTTILLSIYGRLEMKEYHKTRKSLKTILVSKKQIKLYSEVVQNNCYRHTVNDHRRLMHAPISLEFV